MLTQLIFRSSPPQINYFPENTEEQPKQYYLMREENSLFESILNTMKSSTSQSKNDCSNPNCKNVFFKMGKCRSCGNNFCDKCLVYCENCNEVICKFCSVVRYEKTKDVVVCPNCNYSYDN